MIRKCLFMLGGLALAAAPRIAAANFVDVQQSSLQPASGTITFGEVPLGAYGAIPYQVSGGPFNGSQIIFGSYFQGQTPQGTDPITIPEPSAPGQPLQLLYDNGNFVEVVDDAASPSNPVLAGGPLTFRQPISIQFTTPVPAIALTAGYLNTIGTLSIAAYDAAGNELGTVTNDALGFEQFGLLADSGVGISGLTIQDSDTGGFEIDNVFLAIPMPEPASSLAELLVGLVGMVFLSRRRLLD